MVSSGTLDATNLSFSGGTITRESINLSFSGTSPNLAYSGTVNVDSMEGGVDYATAIGGNTLSLNSNTQAAFAAQAANTGLGVVMGSPTSWTSNGTNVSYSPGSGVSMSGTVTSGSGTGYNISVNFTDYSSNGYTVSSGSLDPVFTLVGTWASGSFSGTIGGTVIVSGASVTWNSVSVSGATGGSGSPTHSGTISYNGTAFDVKTLL